MRRPRGPFWDVWEEKGMAEDSGAVGRLWHGGAPGLRPGDMIEPGHERRAHEGCAWCEARARGESPGADPLARPDRVYLTGHRGYARHYASLWGRGDLYRVEPVGPLERSLEDTIESWTAPGARVLAVVERAILLTWKDRRKLFREWGIADEAAAPGWASAGLGGVAGVSR